MTQTRPLSEALRDFLEDAGVSYRALSASLTDYGLPRTKDTVSLWVNGVQTMRPEEVFAVEDVLELEPGTLSRFDGYLPVSAVPAMTAEQAIKADPRLRASARRFLLAALRGVLEETD